MTDEDKLEENGSDSSLIQPRRHCSEPNTATVTKISEDANFGSVHSSRRTQFLAHNYLGETAVLQSAWIVTDETTAEADTDGKLMYLADPKPIAVVQPPSETSAKDTFYGSAKEQSVDTDDKVFEDKVEDKRGSKSYYDDRK